MQDAAFIVELLHYQRDYVSEISHAITNSTSSVTL